MKEKQCRTCLQMKKCSFKLNDKVKERFIWEALKSIANISISVGDGWTQWICKSCYEKLNDTIEFQLEIEKNDKFLQSNVIECVTVIKTEDEIPVKSEPEETVILEPKVTINESTVIPIEKVELIINTESALKRKRKKKRKVTEFRCCFCQNSFKLETDLNSHMTSLHAFAIQENVNQKCTAKYKRECKYCKLKFRLRRSIELHLEDPAYEEPRNHRQEEYLKRKLKKMSESKEERKVVCVICGKIYANQALQRDHEMRVHAETFPFPCTQPNCDKRFPAEYIMKIHVRDYHAEKKFICNICGKGFMKERFLVTHSYLHKEVKRYQCAHCPRSFTYRNMIQRHVESHFQEKAYRCDQCEKTYKWQDDLKRHIQCVHLGDPPYKCKYCNKGYFSSSSRKYHQQRCQRIV